MENTVYQIVRDAEDNYINGSSKLGKYVDFDMYETISTIDAYLNSKHTTGLTDSLNREKPFFNIVTSACNIWYRATDLDRKNIRFIPSNTDSVALAFLANIQLQRWMDKNNFGKFLNDWGRTLAKYGSAIVKFVEKDGDLIASVVPWSRFIADPVDFDAIPRIEKFYKTPAQLRKMEGYNQDVVEDLISSVSSRKTLGNETVDNNSNFIEIYEVHGEMTVATYKKAKGIEPADGDDKIYKQQMHVISYVEGEKEGEYADFNLYCGYEKEDPYMITHLIEEDGRTLAIGAVELLFDAQWMQNHSIKQWRDQLDIASKILFQTSDANYLGRNVLSALENGDILIHAENQPLTQINNQGHDSSSLSQFQNVWKVLEQELTSTPDAIRGSTLPSGTPYRLAAILQQEGNSLFELMTENKGLALEEMLRRKIIPNLKKKLDTDEEIMAALDDAGITELESMYVPRKAIEDFNKNVIDQVLNQPLGVEMPQFDQNNAEMVVKQSFQSLGNRRGFKPTVIKDGKEVSVKWKEIFSDFEWDNIKVEITNENKDKNSVLTTLTSLYQTLAQTDPDKANVILGKIMTETGAVSPMELPSLKKPTPMAPPGAQVGGGVASLLSNGQQ